MTLGSGHRNMGFVSHIGLELLHARQTTGDDSGGQLDRDSGQKHPWSVIAMGTQQVLQLSLEKGVPGASGRQDTHTFIYL